jgi:hypothetical protein
MIGASVPTIDVGQIVTPLVLVIFLVFGGLFVNLDRVPVVLRWVQWISFISYTNKVIFAPKDVGSSSKRV